MRDGWTGDHLGGFNIDGPHTPESTAAAARQIAELVRYLNHATLADEALPEPADTARVLGELADAAERMRQLLGQIAGRLKRYEPLGSDDGNPVASRAETVAAAVAAWAHLEHATAELRRARDAAARLYLDV